MKKLMFVFAAVLLITACTKEEIINQSGFPAQNTSIKMGKILYTYGGFTAAQLKERASIPSQADITAGSNYIDCSSIDIPTEIRDVIGEGSNDLGTIYTSAKVNKWSGFGPWTWYVSGGVLYFIIKSNPYDMSNFCGYNHNARQTSISGQIATIRVNAGQSANIGITCTLDIGEVNWSAIGGIAKIAFKSSIGGSLLGVTYYDINCDVFDLQNLFTATNTQNQTITNELFFVDSNNVKVADIPNISSFNTALVVNVVAVVGGCVLADSEANPSIFLHVNSFTINQGNETYSLNLGGIYDESIPGYVSRVCNLYAQLNIGAMVTCNKSITFYGNDNAQTVAGTLPFNIDYNDVVYFELR
ncbi:MAG TPA: hypothetical protein VFC67_20930 [Prolixibacteraceae bacterium]|nr:hypothetical protein [Prolixibacteraceae bacterium]